MQHEVPILQGTEEERVHDHGDCEGGERRALATRSEMMLGISGGEPCMNLDVAAGAAFYARERAEQLQKKLFTLLLT